MAYLATKRFNYWGQLGILTAFTGVGLIIGALASYIPFIGIVEFEVFSSPKFLKNFLKPEYANAFRWMGSLTNLFLFLLPAFFYSLVCHKKPFKHLGFKRKFNLLSAGVIILIMFASLFIVSSLQDLTEMLPWSKATILKFKEAENEYNGIIGVMARMDSFGEYLLTLIVIAFLPALFEETIFRGALQNLLSRWFKLPILGIVVTAILFSAVHLSYLGFLPRFALGFVLGWIYYRTGNLWLSVFGHFLNNAFAVTMLYSTTKAGSKPDLSKMEDHFPIWIGILAIAAVYYLLTLFDKVSKKELDHPGEEVPIPGVAYTNNPFEDYPPTIDKTNQY